MGEFPDLMSRYCTGQTLSSTRRGARILPLGAPRAFLSGGTDPLLEALLGEREEYLLPGLRPDSGVTAAR
jgi:hypothetical protein